MLLYELEVWGGEDPCTSVGAAGFGVHRWFFDQCAARSKRSQ